MVARNLHKQDETCMVDEVAVCMIMQDYWDLQRLCAISSVVDLGKTFIVQELIVPIAIATPIIPLWSDQI